MYRLAAVIILLILSTGSPYTWAGDYLPGQAIPSSPSFGERLRDALFPGFRRQSESGHTLYLTPKGEPGYVFEDAFANRDQGILKDREAPVGNILKLRF